MKEPLNGICTHAFIRSWLDPQLTSGPLIAEKGCRNCESNYFGVGINPYDYLRSDSVYIFRISLTKNG